MRFCFYLDFFQKVCVLITNYLRNQQHQFPKDNNAKSAVPMAQFY
jgi:hypothetical protein